MLNNPVDIDVNNVDKEDNSSLLSFSSVIQPTDPPNNIPPPPTTTTTTAATSKKPTNVVKFADTIQTEVFNNSDTLVSDKRPLINKNKVSHFLTYNLK
jgi:hypothetical protein